MCSRTSSATPFRHGCRRVASFRWRSCVSCRRTAWLAPGPGRSGSRSCSRAATWTRPSPGSTPAATYPARHSPTRGHTGRGSSAFAPSGTATRAGRENACARTGSSTPDPPSGRGGLGDVTEGTLFRRAGGGAAVLVHHAALRGLGLLAWAAAAPLPGDDHAVVEDLPAPDAPRLGPLDRAGEAGRLEWALPAVCLCQFKVGRQLGEPQLRVLPLASDQFGPAPGVSCQCKEGVVDHVGVTGSRGCARIARAWPGVLGPPSQAVRVDDRAVTRVKWEHLLGSSGPAHRPLDRTNLSHRSIPPSNWHHARPTARYAAW